MPNGIKRTKQERNRIMNAKEMFRVWMDDPYYDEATKAELKEIEGNDMEIEARFCRSLSFGTGGLRGILGAGTNRMNIYTVRKATQGLAEYILEQKAEKKGVAIAFDSRNMSSEFAEEAALTLAANKIRAYVFPSLRPTPMLSFAVRELGCTAGIVITASHNPKEYNGYKVYWEDGGQITAPKDREIIEKVNAVTEDAAVRTMTKDEAKALGFYCEIGSEIDEKYYETLKKLVLCPEVLHREAANIKIVYTPLNGTGSLPVQRMLKELGFTQTAVVKEQEMPDGNFSTVASPNPEDAKAFALALELAEETDADLVLATDPDADRLGMYAKDTAAGGYAAFTGNMIGMLILDYIVSRKKENGTLPADGAVVTTIVSGKMAKELVKAYGMTLVETLTGFKYIGEQIGRFEREDRYRYVFGYEESYGCLAGTYARDKDAVSAASMLCEAAAYWKSLHMTLVERMEQLYEMYGYFKEDLRTVKLKETDGVKQAAEIIEGIRNRIPKQVCSQNVTEFRDYREDLRLHMASGRRTKTGLPKSNVLYFELEDASWFCIRPSGTEPKIKFYAGVKGGSHTDADEKLQALMEAVERLAT